MSAVDMTKCQPGDRLQIRCGEPCFYHGARGIGWHVIGGLDWSVVVDDDGRVNRISEYRADVIAVAHPTRAELEEQRRELLEACKAALAALSQPMTYPADIAAAKRWLADAAIKAEATHE